MFDILIIEDTAEDALFLQTALRQIQPQFVFKILRDGLEALRWIKKDPPFDFDPFIPDMIFVDLNLPVVDGFEVLEALNASPYSTVPTFVLTTSSSSQDILRAYSLSINAYMRKPLEPSRYIEKVRALCDFWLKHVILPSRLPTE